MNYETAKQNLGKIVLFTNSRLYIYKSKYKLFRVRRVRIRGEIYEQAILQDLITKNDVLLICRLEEIEEEK